MEDIYVFPAAHTRTKKKHRGLRVDRLELDTLLATKDDDGDAKGPGLFLCTNVTILFNINTPWG
jgi:hypothetical protein